MHRSAPTFLSSDQEPSRTGSTPSLPCGSQILATCSLFGATARWSCSPARCSKRLSSPLRRRDFALCRPKHWSVRTPVVVSALMGQLGETGSLITCSHTPNKSLEATCEDARASTVTLSVMSSAISNLAALLASMKPSLNAGVYAYCVVPHGADISALAPVATVCESEGLTLVLPEEQAIDAGLSVLFRAAWITLQQFTPICKLSASRRPSPRHWGKLESAVTSLQAPSTITSLFLLRTRIGRCRRSRHWSQKVTR